MQEKWDSSIKCRPAPRLVEMAHTLARPMVFTNGVFDLLHVGHVICLERASQQGCSLVVALNSDASVRGLGKPGRRPINALADRARVIAGLACVSWVTSFDEATPAALIEALRPDVYAKGGDYRAEELEEMAQLSRWGGRVVILPYLAGHSSSRLIGQLGLGLADTP